MKKTILASSLLLASCAVKSDYKVTREKVGDGIIRYSNHEVTCYEFLGLNGFEIKCKFTEGGASTPIPEEIYKLVRR